MYLDLSKLPVGGKWRMNDKEYVVLKVVVPKDPHKQWPYLRISVNGKATTFKPLYKGWEQFCRDVNGVAMGYMHGCEAGVIGDLVEDQWADFLKEHPRRVLKTC